MNCIINPLGLRGKDVTRDATMVSCKAHFSELQLVKEEFLGTNELEYYNSIPSINRQYSYLHGRYVAKTALKTYLKVPIPAAVQISSGIFNQPIIEHPDVNHSQISISHSGEWATCIVFPEAIPLGLDIERVDFTKDWTRLVPLSETERANLLSGSLLTSPQPYTLIWTIKEALSKAIKTGLTVNPKIFEIASIDRQNDHWEASFQYFTSFKAYCWQYEEYIWTIVHPAKIALVGGVI
ncbi:4'-phosphopantetheinyl transferase family protein [Dyadobacter tibetensis]|uniref:4'-phosphopantetheinyl transferase family protein n=1 Tax=Dyadobacter tibetensis TaxID=1211851 RepID=UPI00046EFB77|nr:4'-phosphopantetheinyl transferase superfamily protein [Dyadobacter tibetensis]